MIVAASTLAVAAILVVLVLGAAAQAFFMVDESNSGIDPDFGGTVEVDEPTPIISDEG